ncbi:hypothetical protein CENSYa_0024 [Cenarchaeum symbiosum A]|uniref:PRC-barrel domain-containing protein n=1 Tax=Cenarchaeum symbiosum (strain A) TaxID=414004 RepID=A0RTL5_CENSY|nr:hypothetical protein CENSYa_0024 [Cenarchaeum symbiosum A]
MSSEMRLKKLRGSGGYVMANVTDDQQRKANLGGPDLFLAPIGRLEADKITKYSCNTCEKEYEGSPKIEFENSKEEVAENLFLAERGQYICATCGSTIAEYREFEKGDEGSDIGKAKPAEGYENVAQPEQQMQTQQGQIQMEPGQHTHPMQDQVEPQVLQEQAQLAQTPKPAPKPAKLTPISGMAVFDGSGVKVGTAGEVCVDQDQKAVLSVTGAAGELVAVEWSRVKKIGEIILLGEPGAGSAGKCPGCGFSNKPDSKFCEQCGNQI